MRSSGHQSDKLHQYLGGQNILEIQHAKDKNQFQALDKGRQLWCQLVLSKGRVVTLSFLGCGFSLVVQKVKDIHKDIVKMFVRGTHFTVK